MVRICSPKNSIEFDQYFQLRWEILRAPWQQPKGSEQDEHESEAFHIMALNSLDEVIGVGRLHQLGNSNAQIRYMAVKPEERLHGTGSKILQALEEQAIKQERHCILLNARDTALEFYLRHGYEIIAKGPTLYDEINHTRMQKTLA